MPRTFWWLAPLYLSALGLASWYLRESGESFSGNTLFSGLLVLFSGLLVWATLKLGRVETHFHEWTKRQVEARENAELICPGKFLVNRQHEKGKDSGIVSVSFQISNPSKYAATLYEIKLLGKTIPILHEAEWKWAPIYPIFADPPQEMREGLSKWECDAFRAFPVTVLPEGIIRVLKKARNIPVDQMHIVAKSGEVELELTYQIGNYGAKITEHILPLSREGRAMDVR